MSVHTSAQDSFVTSCVQCVFAYATFRLNLAAVGLGRIRGRSPRVELGPIVTSRTRGRCFIHTNTVVRFKSIWFKRMNDFLRSYFVMFVIFCGYPGCGRSKAIEYLNRKHDIPYGSIDELLRDRQHHKLTMVSDLNRRSDLARLRCMYPTDVQCIVKISCASICLRNSPNSRYLDEHTHIPYNFVLDNSGDESKFENDLDQLWNVLTDSTEHRTMDLCRLIT